MEINLAEIVNGSMLTQEFMLLRIAGAFVLGGWVQNVSQPILTAVLRDPGSSYRVGDVVNVLQSGASGGTVTVLTLENEDTGVIATIGDLVPGQGYSVATGLPTSGGYGSDATVDITVGPPNPLPISMYGVVSSASDEDILMVPEGDRVTGMMSFHSSQPMYETDPTRTNSQIADQLFWNGNQYKVMRIKPYASYGFWKAVAVRMAGY